MAEWKERQRASGDVDSIPIGGILEVWPWTFGSRTAWLVNKSAGQPQFLEEEATQPSCDSEAGDPNPCSEDEEFFFCT